DHRTINLRSAWETVLDAGTQLRPLGQSGRSSVDPLLAGEKGCESVEKPVEKRDDSVGGCLEVEFLTYPEFLFFALPNPFRSLFIH
ncbi:MAG: hypothetical protein WBC04_26330, partial [Candidatus Acidiferrales bacterium]